MDVRGRGIEAWSWKQLETRKNARKTIYVFAFFMIFLFTLIFVDEKGNLASSCILNLIREKTIRSVGTDPGKGIMETKSITRDVRQIAYGLHYENISLQGQTTIDP